MLRLTNKKLLDFLENGGHVCHTLIPELVKFTEKNKVGMHANPIDIKMGPLGHMIFLTLNRELKLSNLYIAQLHNPVSKIDLLKEDIKAKEIHYSEGISFYMENGTNISYHLLPEKNVKLNLKKLEKNVKLNLKKPQGS